MENNKNKPIPFSELNQFRQVITSTPQNHFQLYTSTKPKALTYRAIFAGIAFLFIALACVIHWGTPQPLFRQYFVNSSWLQGSVTFFSGIIALSSASLSATLRTEKEAMHTLFSQARKKLGRLHNTYRAKMGWLSWFPFSPHYQRFLDLKESYHQTFDTMERKKEELLHLFIKIRKSTPIHPNMKETLYNQALLEFWLNLDHNVAQFEGETQELITWSS